MTSLLLTVGLPACDSDHDDHDDHDHDDHEHNETELITTIDLIFTAEDGAVTTATFSDPDGDGGASGTAEPIMLAPNTSYTMTLEFYNDLEDEEVTPEIIDESADHQVFVYGDAVSGPATDIVDGLVSHEYADRDEVGLPIGLVNTITTFGSGEGDFRVMLRHLPPLNGMELKVEGLADVLAAGDPLPGLPDTDVTFGIIVE